MTDPLAIDRFTVRLDSVYNNVVIADRDLTPLTGDVAESILGDRGAAVIWYTSPHSGYIVFPVTDAGWSMAQILADQLNDLDATNDAAQSAELIDSAATLAEQIEAAATLAEKIEADADADAGRRQRAIAAYQRAAELPPYPWPDGCPEPLHPGERVQIGAVDDRFTYGVMSGVDLPARLRGQHATVLLPAIPWCPLIVLTDDDDVVALPMASLYVRRLGGAA